MFSICGLKYYTYADIQHCQVSKSESPYNRTHALTLISKQCNAYYQRYRRRAYISTDEIDISGFKGYVKDHNNLR